jgi:hypothetical protein
MKFKTTFAKPSAWMPLAFSLFALAIVVIHFVQSGHAQGGSAKTIVRVVELILLAQAPFVGFHAIRWLPEEPRPGALVLGVHLAFVLLAIGAMVYFV